jgi:hypothetical protein
MKRITELSVMLIVITVLFCQFDAVRAASNRPPIGRTPIDGCIDKLCHGGFVLGHWLVEFIVDKAREWRGGILSDEDDARSSDANGAGSKVWMRLGNGLLVSYDYTPSDISSSQQEPRLKQKIHFFEEECGLADRLNVMVIVQPDYVRGSDDDRNGGMDANVDAILSWEYERGSYVYLVFTESKRSKQSLVFYERTQD